MHYALEISLSFCVSLAIIFGSLYNETRLLPRSLPYRDVSLFSAVSAVLGPHFRRRSRNRSYGNSDETMSATSEKTGDAP
jgi:hypothetical protein